MVGTTASRRLIIYPSFITIFYVLLTSCGSRQSFSEAEFPARSVTIGGVSYAYRIYVPPGIIAGKKQPVMLYLHGSNRRGSDNQSQVLDLLDVVKTHPENFRYIIVFPQCRENKYWAGEMNEQALAALDATVKEFGGDENQLFLAGYSMGGNGTWQNGLIHPGRFAALIPIAGEVAPRGQLTDEVLASLPPKLREAAVSPDPYKIFAEGIGNTAVWVFHGAKDEAVPVSESRKIVEAFKAAGNTKVNYTEFENIGHGAVGPAFSSPDLGQWLTNQRLDAK